MSDVDPSGLWLRPAAPPANPTASTARRAMLEEIQERIVSGLERAQALAEAERERASSAAAGATGETMDGDVLVRVDSKGMISAAEFGPQAATLDAEELREETLAALEAAKSELGLGARPSAQAVDALFDRTVADALLRFLNPKDAT